MGRPWPPPGPAGTPAHEVLGSRLALLMHKQACGARPGSWLWNSCTSSAAQVPPLGVEAPSSAPSLVALGASRCFSSAVLVHSIYSTQTRSVWEPRGKAVRAWQCSREGALLGSLAHVPTSCAPGSCLHSSDSETLPLSSPLGRAKRRKHRLSSQNRAESQALPLSA